jgi:hypothetical protein
MLRKSSKSAVAFPRVSRHHHRVKVLFHAAVAVSAFFLCFSARHARADETHVEIAGKAFYGNLGVGLLGVGLEGAYFPSPHYGFGGAVSAFVVDNGADPHYSENGTLDDGIAAFAFAEGDLLPGWVTPYARLGLGLGRLERFYDSDIEYGLDFVGELSGGVAVRGGPVVLRLAVTPSLYGSDLFLAYSASLGGRF